MDCCRNTIGEKDDTVAIAAGVTEPLEVIVVPITAYLFCRLTDLEQARPSD